MLKLAIVHFNPIDLYPPVMNWLSFLTENTSGKMEIRVFTREPSSDIPQYVPKSPALQIIRWGNPDTQNSLKRIWGYFRFYISTTWKLASWKPDSVLYYETLSSFPAIFYKKFIKHNAGLLVHYHEYTSPVEYRDEMTLNRWWHRLEKRNYSLYKWISHTNEDRMRLFLEDNEGIDIPNTHILPNYPPIRWQGRNYLRNEGGSVKFIYVGSISLDTMYTKEFESWIREQKGKATWDIYSNNMAGDVQDYFSKLGNDAIRIHGGINYYLLPEILRNYDIGLILYKGHIPNYIYNVPNKLPEYFACGLDVWLPNSMISSLGFVTTDTYPRIIAINFQNLGQLDFASITNRTGLGYKPSSYYVEDFFEYFLKNVLESA
jgi:hypothetical protein